MPGSLNVRLGERGSAGDDGVLESKSNGGWIRGTGQEWGFTSIRFLGLVRFCSTFLPLVQFQFMTEV